MRPETLAVGCGLLLGTTAGAVFWLALLALSRWAS